MPHAWASSRAEAHFESALLAETGERDIQKAIGLYKQVLSEAVQEPALEAKAKLHLGMCYEDIDKTKEAISCYQSLLAMPGVPPALRASAQRKLNRLQNQLASLLSEGSTHLISAGGDQSAAVQKDGTVLWWGSNPALGTAARPSLLEGLTAVQNISLGSAYWLVLNQDGTVWAEGSNAEGQLGDGTTENRSQPVPIEGLSGIRAVVAGDTHSLALQSDGKVWAWGANRHGQLGDGTFSRRLRPVQVSGLSRVMAVACSGEHSAAVQEDGSVWTWGANDAGQLGLSVPILASPIPKKLSSLSSIVGIAAGQKHVLAVQSYGSVWAWGDNSFGQLGLANLARSDHPLQVPGLTKIRAVAAGPNYSLALKEDGSVWSWGDNHFGALGNGDVAQRPAPTPVYALYKVQAIAAGQGQNLALQETGRVWAWGRNNRSQIGDGTVQDRLIPIPISSVKPSRANNPR